MSLEDTPPRAARGERSLLRLVCPAYPAFNIYSRSARIMTALGPVCVATAVNELDGWDVEVIDENNYQRGPRGPDGLPDHEALQRARPADVVGLYGGLTSTVPRLYDVAALYRRLGVRTVAGGQHFVEDNIDRALRQGIDVVVRGEGEETIGELLGCLRSAGELSAVRGIAYLDGGRVVRTPERPPLTDFDALPIPDFSVLRYARLKIFSVSGVRGCGMNCEFCTVKGRPRRASPERIMEQFATAYEKWRARTFFIVDDLFGQNREETLRLCGMLREYQEQARTRFSVTVQIRLDKARDAELLEAMRQAGVRMVAIGFESPIAEELRAMNKRLDPAEMIALARVYRGAGFRVHGMFIFGYPMREGQSFHMSVAERVGHFRRFIRRARLDTVQVLLPVPLPGTALTHRLREQGRIYPTDCVGLEYYDGNFPLFEPDDPLTPEDMQWAAHRIMGRFYRPGHILSVGLSILSFPALIFWLHRLRSGWHRWSRRWWRNVYRTGGWLTLRRWTAAFEKDPFLAKLAEAKRRLQAP
jgi:radical SAM superfamily enzyme YgiQ (UPF0313 family)